MQTKTLARSWQNFALGEILDVITCANFVVDRSRGFTVTRSQISGFSIGFRRRPYNTLALCEWVCDFAEDFPANKQNCLIVTRHVRSGKRGYKMLRCEQWAKISTAPATFTMLCSAITLYELMFTSLLIITVTLWDFDLKIVTIN